MDIVVFLSHSQANNTGKIGHTDVKLGRDFTASEITLFQAFKFRNESSCRSDCYSEKEGGGSEGESERVFVYACVCVYCVACAE